MDIICYDVTLVKVVKKWFNYSNIIKRKLDWQEMIWRITVQKMLVQLYCITMGEIAKIPKYWRVK